MTDDKIIYVPPNFLKFTINMPSLSRFLSEPLSIFVKLQVNITEIEKVSVAKKLL